MLAHFTRCLNSFRRIPGTAVIPSTTFNQITRSRSISNRELSREKWYFTLKKPMPTSNSSAFFLKKTPLQRKKQDRSKRYRLNSARSMFVRFFITGPRWDREFYHKSQGQSHLKRNKSKNNLSRNRKMKAISNVEHYKIKRSIPTWKMNRKLKKYVYDPRESRLRPYDRTLL